MFQTQPSHSSCFCVVPPDKAFSVYNIFDMQSFFYVTTLDKDEGYVKFQAIQTHQQPTVPIFSFAGITIRKFSM